MTINALDDLDRSKSGIATGNVITGANTMSGAAGKDGLGTGPNHVTQVDATMVPVGGADVMGTWGKLHINQDGSYTYTRTANIWDAGGVGATEVFTYTLADKNNSDTAKLTINLLPEVVTTTDKNGVHTGTAYDDFIDGQKFAYDSNHHAVWLNGGDGADKLVGNDQADVNYLTGGAGNDWLIAKGNSDRLEGGAGADELDGSATNGEYAVYTASKAGVTVDLMDNQKNQGGDAEGDILISIQDVTGSKFADTLSGDGNGNRLVGGAGNDVLDGRDGKDDLYGEAGNDTIKGGDGDDILDGGLGADSLVGGMGTDWAYYWTATSSIVVDLADPSKNGGEAKGDTFNSIEGYLGTNFNDTLRGDDTANLFDGGSGNDTLVGGKGSDTLQGNWGDDVLIGGEGADILDGGNSWADVASYAYLTSGITIWVGNTANSDGDAKGDTYQNVEIILGTQGDDALYNDDSGQIFLHGGNGNDAIIGGTGDNYLFGDAGNDTLVDGINGGTLEGGAGADILIGSNGHDIASYSTATGAVTLDLLNAAADKGDAKGDQFSSIEEYWGSSFSDKIYGTDNADTLLGLEGNDTLQGRGGDDHMSGVAGNDTLSGGAGNDTLSGGIGSDKLLGGDDADILNGGYDNDTLNGDGGSDTLHGDQGSDKLDGGAGNDDLYGDDGNDTLTGGLGNDSLYGGAGNDVLIGGDGDDIIYGGDGTDKLSGGAGTDFFYIKATDTDGKDTITDFKVGEDHLILADILDGGGDNLQDLLDAGIQASSKGSTLTITEGDHVMLTMTGWSGPQIGSIQDLSIALGSDLHVQHA